MFKLGLMTVTVITLLSCENGVNENNNKVTILGEWSAYQCTNITNNDTSTSVLVSDLIFFEDSVQHLNFPYQIQSKNPYSIMGDSLYSDLFGKNKVHWSVNDSILTLVRQGETTNGILFKTIEKYEKTSFDNKTLQALNKDGVNKEILLETNWYFWEKGTRKYDWKNYDTLFYNPSKLLVLDTLKKDPFLGQFKFTYKKDTFNILDFRPEFLCLQVERNNTKITLSYMDSATFEFNK